jgi:hypothetical protein
MSNHITPTLGRIVWYRGNDGRERAAIVTFVNGPFNVNLYVFGSESIDPECGPRDSVTHADPEHEPGCIPSWHWMPYQKQQAEKHATEAARADEPKLASTDTTDAAIERDIQAAGLTAPRVTPAHIDALMQRIVCTSDVRPNGSTTTLVHAFLDGSFFLASGVSACVSVENFDAQIGLKIATENAMRAAREKLWELEGYLLHAKLTR